MKAANPNAEYNYICKADRDLPESEQTTFVLTHLTAEQNYKLDDVSGISGDDGFIITLGTSNLLAIHMGLKAVKNLVDEKSGNEIELKRDETKGKKTLPGVGRPWKMNLIDKIPKDARDEIALVIKNGGELTEAEAKN